LTDAFSAGLFIFLTFFGVAAAMRFFGGFVMAEQIDQKARKAMHTATTCHDSKTCFIMSKLGNILNFRQKYSETQVGIVNSILLLSAPAE
jgi:hypothetical protein